jgi:hypothetical protein
MSGDAHFEVCCITHRGERSFGVFVINLEHKTVHVSQGSRRSNGKTIPISQIHELELDTEEVGSLCIIVAENAENATEYEFGSDTARDSFVSLLQMSNPAISITVRHIFFFFVFFFFPICESWLDVCLWKFRPDLGLGLILSLLLQSRHLTPYH